MIVKIFFFVLMIFSFAVNAAEILEYNQSVKAAGMGGVRVFKDDDGSVILYNPAGLARIQGFHWRVANINAGINGQDIYTSISDAGEIDGIEDLDSFYGKRVWIGVGAHTAIATPYFGFAYYNNSILTFLLENPAFPNMELTSINDTGYVFGFAFPIGPSFSFGVNLKRVDRIGGTTTLGPGDLVSISESTLTNAIQDRGSGYGADLGILYKFPTAMNPMVSLTWFDVGQTSFNPTSDTGNAPPAIKDNVTLGLTFESSAMGFGVNGGLEYRHINLQGEQLGKKIHMGVELEMPLLDLRAGLYQGYTTYGIGLDLWLIQLEAASYKVETGAYPGQSESERLVLSFSLDLGFDADFGLTSAGGKKRRLKQRR